jgi:hypothetical protein
VADFLLGGGREHGRLNGEPTQDLNPKNGAPVLPLREIIQKAIESGNGDAAKAAIAVCVVLEDEIGLAGNGWFDGDDVLEDALRGR